jgi:hypothetical protein
MLSSRVISSTQSLRGTISFPNQCTNGLPIASAECAPNSNSRLCLVRDPLQHQILITFSAFSHRRATRASLQTTDLDVSVFLDLRPKARRSHDTRSLLPSGDTQDNSTSTRSTHARRPLTPCIPPLSLINTFGIEQPITNHSGWLPFRDTMLRASFCSLRRTRTSERKQNSVQSCCLFRRHACTSTEITFICVFDSDGKLACVSSLQTVPV